MSGFVKKVPRMVQFQHDTKLATTQWWTAELTRNGLTAGEVVEVIQTPGRFAASTISEFLELSIKCSAESVRPDD